MGSSRILLSLLILCKKCHTKRENCLYKKRKLSACRWVYQGGTHTLWVYTQLSVDSVSAPGWVYNVSLPYFELSLSAVFKLTLWVCCRSDRKSFEPVVLAWFWLKIWAVFGVYRLWEQILSMITLCRLFFVHRSQNSVRQISAKLSSQKSKNSVFTTFLLWIVDFISQGAIKSLPK